MSLADLNVALVAATGVLLLALVGLRLTARTGLPGLLGFLAVGLLVGEAGLGVRFSDFALTQTLGLLALAVIVAEGGLATRWEAVRPTFPLAVVLATLGVGVSVAVVAGAAVVLLDLPIRTALLLGAAVSSTDAAAVFSVMRTLPLSPRLRSALEAESGLNDPPVVLLVTLVLTVEPGDVALLEAGGRIAYQLVAGIGVGAAVAILSAALLRRSALPSAGLYPVTVLLLCLGAYGGAGLIGASGLLAAYFAGLVFGNADVPHRRAISGFAESAAWLAQIGLFVVLGLLASPARLPAALGTALVVGAVLTMVARPLSVAVCALPFRVPWREQAFMSWAGLRGAVPIVLATFPVIAAVPRATQIFDAVFVLVVVYTAIQGPRLPWLAQRLGVVDMSSRALTVDVAPLDEAHADVLSTTVTEGSRLSGLYPSELRLPTGATLALIVRNGAPLAVDEFTAVAVGDRLIIVCLQGARSATEQRLRQLHLGGRLARWYGASGTAGTDRRG